MAEAESVSADVNFDEDGFLQTVTSWNRSTVEKLAKENDIGPLTEAHWKIIEFIKDYYETNASSPPVVRICKATGMSREEVCDLFPCGVVRGAYRLAGLPRPPGCG